MQAAVKFSSRKVNVQLSFFRHAMPGAKRVRNSHYAMTWFFIFLLHLNSMGYTLQLTSSECVPVQIDTTSGLLEGCDIYVESRQASVKQFLGVPYAEQPIGHRRFRRPVLKERSPKLLITKEFGNICPQNHGWLNSVDVNFTIGEDCLWLNLYAPESASENRTVDVMFFIHGGSYLDGTGSYYEGKHLALVGNVVVVTINYRLGLLGFLSSEDSTLMGNYGLWDQLMALQWVQKNIKKFGGDPKRVTIFGNSAGSSSVGILALSPKSKGFFRRIITQSGSPLTPWAFVRNPRRFVEKLSHSVHCTRDSKVEDFPLVDCMRLLTAEEIFKLQHLGHVKWSYPEGSLLWAPWVDGELILHDPEELIANKSYWHTPEVKLFGEYDQLIGVTNQEAAFVYEAKMKIGNKDKVPELTHKKYRSLLREVSAAVVPIEYTDAFESVLRFSYREFDQPVTSKDRVVQYINIYSDYAIYTGTLSLAKFHYNVAKGKGKTFFYRFDYRASWRSREAWRVGATHEDELPFVFGYPEVYSQGSVMERALADTMMILWSNFARNG